MERVILEKDSPFQSDESRLALRWTMIGHSYGSFIVSGIYQDIIRDHSRGIPDEVKLPRLVLLDPVTLCLSQPTTVCFLMLDAMDWSSYIMQHLAAKELMIA